MDRNFARYDRVRLSAKGRVVYNRHPPDRVGTVVHEPVTGRIIQVKWDGCTAKASYPYQCLEFADARAK